MMRTVFLSLLFAVILQSCAVDCVNGIGTAVEEERDIGEFSGIRSSSSFRVTLRDRVLGGSNRLLVKAQKNLMPQVKTDVSGNTLVIDSEGCFTASEPIEVLVFVNEISTLINSGSGDMVSENALRGDNLEITSSGSGSVIVKLKVNNTEIYHSGSGNVLLSGQTNVLEIKSSGSGDTRCSRLRAGNADVVNTGSGDVSVLATNEMVLKLNGSGDITYSGKPEKFKQDDDGSGEISEGNDN